MEDDFQGKKLIIKRNMLAILVGLIVVFIVVTFAPFYSIMTDMKVTYLDLTMTQINTRYLYIVVGILFVVFAVSFYLTKFIFNLVNNVLKNRKEAKKSDN